MNPEIMNQNITNENPDQVGLPKKCKHMPMIIVLVILVAIGFGFGGFELWQNIRKDEEIRTLQAANDAMADKGEDKGAVIEYYIELSKSLEQFEEGKLKIEFTGIKNPDGEDFYNYVADIKYNDKNIDSTFFNDKNNYRIWSTNMASDFVVYEIDDVYILSSSLAANWFFNEVMIFNTKGKVLKTFSGVDFLIEGKKISIGMPISDQCGSDGMTPHEQCVEEHSYIISGFNLLEDN